MYVSPVVDAALAGVLGLMVGSFLNVVIYRLPRMVARDWLASANDIDAADDLHRMVFKAPVSPEWMQAVRQRTEALAAAPRLSLAAPSSHCPSCGHAIRWYENIPVASYVFLKGRCSACGTRISARYPVVEAVTGAIFAIAVLNWGLSLQAALWAAFAAILVCQFLIDLDTQYLPEELNYPLLWIGLLASTLGMPGWQVTPTEALWGAALGWFLLWAVAKGFQLLKGYEGMGVGDLKLLAAMGAWFGAKFLLALILMSSLVGAVVGIAMLASGRLANRATPMPFGPYLAGAGIVCMAIGPQRMPAIFPFAFPFGG